MKHQKNYGTIHPIESNATWIPNGNWDFSKLIHSVTANWSAFQFVCKSNVDVSTLLIQVKWRSHLAFNYIRYFHWLFHSFTGHKDTPICGVPKFECLTKLEEKMVNDEFLYGADSYCNCLPACTSMVSKGCTTTQNYFLLYSQLFNLFQSYDVEISQAKFDFPKYIQAVSPEEVDISM